MATIKVKRKTNTDIAGSLVHGELGVTQNKLFYGNQTGNSVAVATETEVNNLLSSKISFDETLMNTNPFGGKRLYINSINNAIFNADLRWTVTAKTYLKSNNAFVSDVSTGTLFNGNYDSSITVPAGHYLVVNINFANSESKYNGVGVFPGYPYGQLYLSHYYDGFSESAKLRVYCEYESHGIGWHEVSFTDFVNNGTTNQILQATQSKYAISQMEIIIYAKDNAIARPSVLDFKLDRPGSNEMPVVDKFKPNKLYFDLDMNNNTIKNVKLDNTSEITDSVATNLQLKYTGGQQLVFKHTSGDILLRASSGKLNLKNVSDSAYSPVATEQWVNDNKQPKHASLTSISGLTTSANQILYTTNTNTYATTTITAFGRTLIDDANAAGGRSTLGLKALAILDTVNTDTFDATGSKQLTVAKGGTGAISFTSGQVLVGNGASAVSSLSRSGIDSRSVFPTNLANIAAIQSNRLIGSTPESGVVTELEMSTVRSMLGLGSLAQLSSINNSNWSGTVLSIANGGTGADTEGDARSNLGLGSLATLNSIPNNHVTNAMLADMATARIKGRVTSGTGDPEDLTQTQVREFLGLGTAAYQSASDFQSTITGAATTITSSNLTANRVLVSNANGKVGVSSITSTQLGNIGQTNITNTWTNQQNFRSGIRFNPSTASYILNSPETGGGTLTFPLNKSGTIATTDDIGGGAEVIAILRTGFASGSGQGLTILEMIEFDLTKPYHVIFNAYNASDYLAHSVTRASLGGAISSNYVVIGAGIETAVWNYGGSTGEVYMYGTSGTALRRLEAIVIGFK